MAEQRRVPEQKGVQKEEEACADVLRGSFWEQAPRDVPVCDTCKDIMAVLVEANSCASAMSAKTSIYFSDGAQTVSGTFAFDMRMDDRGFVADAWLGEMLGRRLDEIRLEVQRLKATDAKPQVQIYILMGQGATGFGALGIWRAKLTRVQLQLLLLHQKEVRCLAASLPSCKWREFYVCMHPQTSRGAGAFFFDVPFDASVTPTANIDARATLHTCFLFLQKLAETNTDGEKRLDLPCVIGLFHILISQRKDAADSKVATSRVIE